MPEAQLSSFWLQKAIGVLIFLPINSLALQLLLEQPLEPLPRIEVIPPLEPEYGPLEPKVDGIYEAEDENDKWHVVRVTKVLDEKNGKYTALAAAGSVQDIGLEVVRAEMTHLNAAEEAASVEAASAEREGGTPSSATNSEDTGVNPATIFVERWPVIYRRYMRRIPYLEDPPQGFR